MKKLAYVNTIRGIAIIIVLMSHVVDAGIGSYKIHPLILPFLTAGHLGVQLFFVLSAFTLFRSHELRTETDVSPVKNFYTRRFFRIAPLFYIAIGYYLWQNTVWPGHIFQPTTGHIITSFLFINNLYPYWVTSVVPGGWTIGVEALFYLLLPMFFRYIKNTTDAFNLLLFSLFIRMVVMYFLHHHQFVNEPKIWNPFLYFAFPNQLFVFSLGVLMYFIIKDNYQIKASAISLLLFASLILLESIYGNELFLSKLFYASIAIFVFCIVLSKWQPKAIVNPVSNYIGKVSYSIYLIHFAAIYWMERFGIADFLTVNNSFNALLNFAIRFFVLLGFCLCTGTITYHFIETPFIKLGEHIISKNRK